MGEIWGNMGEIWARYGEIWARYGRDIGAERLRDEVLVLVEGEVHAHLDQVGQRACLGLGLGLGPGLGLVLE